MHPNLNANRDRDDWLLSVKHEREFLRDYSGLEVEVKTYEDPGIGKYLCEYFVTQGEETVDFGIEQFSRFSACEPYVKEKLREYDREYAGAETEWDEFPPPDWEYKLKTFRTFSRDYVGLKMEIRTEEVEGRYVVHLSVNSMIPGLSDKSFTNTFTDKTNFYIFVSRLRIYLDGRLGFEQDA